MKRDFLICFQSSLLLALSSHNGAVQKKKTYGKKSSFHLTLLLFFHSPFFTATQPNKCLEQAFFCVLQGMEYPLLLYSEHYYLLISVNCDFLSPVTHWLRRILYMYFDILVLRAHNPSGLRKGSRALGCSNNRSLQFTDFPSNLANLIG